MPAPRTSLATLLASSSLVLAACGVLPPGGQDPAPVASRGKVGDDDTARAAAAPGSADQLDRHNPKANDVVLFALGLIETGYRFGGKNPEAGLDCSGMVSYVFEKAGDMQLRGSAAELARKGKPVAAEKLRPGDLVFFNTRNKPRSHVGIYIGDDRFVHAPNSRGKVRTESLKRGWFAARFEEGRTYLD
ncbi:C40 family peptidase [Sulfuritalea sp.]|uniref:C40 family peptidase n=1 Tax=Sulfuritalea sp. TaxID=2480090 RepID=UPI001AC46A96|nr:C40 family peptidase [Sulfuritalea sp.]MBN8476733.1 C40 family peptidase [Sulfuritalea sp.]